VIPGTRRTYSGSSLVLPFLVKIKTMLLIMITVIQLLCMMAKAHEHIDSECDIEPYNKYSKENNRWEEYLDSISKATLDYEPCPVESCSSCHDTVYKADLSIFSEGITKELVMQAAQITRTTKYQVVEGNLYRSQDCMFPFRCEGIEHFLLQLAPILPDTEFVVNTRDWPQLNRHMQDKLPVFSFSKTEEFFDIMYPAWAFWGGGPAIGLYPRGLGRWDMHRESMGESARLMPWEEKSDLAFFRGSRTSGERDPLVRLSRKCPKLVDASYTKNQAWKSSKDTLGMEPAEEASLESHCGYKYLFNYRGVAASFRLKHLFLCRSLVFHVGSDWLEFFYPAMKPWVHFIPVSSTAGEQEIAQLLEFVKEHQELARGIAEVGARFVEEQLKMEDVLCYWEKLLRSYTSLLKFTVEKDLTLIKISL